MKYHRSASSIKKPGVPLQMVVSVWPLTEVDEKEALTMDRTIGARGCHYFFVSIFMALSLTNVVGGEGGGGYVPEAVASRPDMTIAVD